MTDLNNRERRRNRCAIAVMAKAPNSGPVKARLTPFLSPGETQDLSCCFLRDITANLSLAAREAPLDTYVAFAPAGTEASFASIVEPSTGYVLADGSLTTPPGVDGFGRCLFQAVWSLFDQGYGAVGLLNSDSPTLPTSSLVSAARILNGPHDCVVLGPSFDGGYYFIGLKGRHPDLFRAIDWSTEKVAEQTRARTRENGLDAFDLDGWYDVDNVAALRRLVDDINTDSLRTAGAYVPYAAPFTTDWLQRHKISDRLAAHFRSGTSLAETFPVRS